MLKLVLTFIIGSVPNVPLAHGFRAPWLASS